MDALETGIIRRGTAARVDMGGFGAEFLLTTGDLTAGLAVVIHPIAPRRLASPRHTHTREDEVSYVLEGAVGVEVGGRTAVALAGDLVAKPRGVPHAFWNAGDTPARVLELITPGGFERYFEELAGILASGTVVPEAMESLLAHYGLQMDMASIAELCTRHGLTAGGRLRD